MGAFVVLVEAAADLLRFYRRVCEFTFKNTATTIGYCGNVYGIVACFAHARYCQ